jgi:hypothetical protein
MVQMTGPQMNVQLVDSAGWPEWTIAQTENEILNDNDKSFTVPAGQEWQILWIWVEYTAGAGADRQLVINVQDSETDIIADLARAGVVIAATEVRNFLFAPGVADLTGYRDTDYLTTPIPVTSILKAGDVLRVHDINNVLAADDMVVQIQYAFRVVDPSA